MNDLIDSIVEHKEIAIFVIGLLLMIGAITKGGISLGSIEIPEIETGQAKLLGGLGFLLILLAGFLYFRPAPEIINTPPKALDDTVLHKLKKRGEVLTETLDLSNKISDVDNDTLRLSILESNLPDESNIIDKIIHYKVSKAGDFYIKYQVSDGKDKANATVKIKVNPPDVKLVTRQGQLISIFGLPQKGKFKTDLENIKETSSEKLIVAGKDGKFNLTTQEENEMCHIFIKKEKPEFFLQHKYEIDTVEYKLLDKIEFTFCNNYDRNLRAPDSSGIVFNNRFKIPFDQLKISTEPNGNLGTLDYGEIHIAVRYFYDKDEYDRNNKGYLNFHFIQKTGDKTIYDPVKIKSNSSPSGWRSYVKKKLLRGEYELIIKSMNGTELESIEFEII